VSRAIWRKEGSGLEKTIAHSRTASKCSSEIFQTLSKILTLVTKICKSGALPVLMPAAELAAPGAIARCGLPGLGAGGGRVIINVDSGATLARHN